MTASQKMVMTLYHEGVLEQVRKQFNNETNIVSIEAYGILFRLFKADAGNINLEISTEIEIGKSEEIVFPVIGKTNIQKSFRFFKPIGFYTNKNEIEITILREFEKEYDLLLNDNKLKTNVITHSLTLYENALLASFSTDTFANAFQALTEFEENGMTSKFEPEYDMMIPAPMRYDKKYIANGLYSELIMGVDGSFLQFHLDDKYGIKGAFIEFIMKSGSLSYAAYKDEVLFHKFNQMSLLNSFKQW